MVQYQLDDPGALEDETILVVGAGDAAIENALALASQNRVIMINRNDEFTRCKDGNLVAVLAAIKEGKIDCRFGTKVERVEWVGLTELSELSELTKLGTSTGKSCNAAFPAIFIAKTPKGIQNIGCHRIIARLGATSPRKLAEGFGIKFRSDDPGAVPALSSHSESNEPGRGEKIDDKSLAKKALKCDMCKGQKGGAACVRACPTGAALRVSPEKFLGYTTDA